MSEIEITPELLADIEAKAKRAIYLYPNRAVLAMIERIRRLEEEVSKRPVVWCLKRIDTGDYVRLGNNTIALWTSEGADEYDKIANIQLDRIQLSKFEPYTGEQS